VAVSLVYLRMRHAVARVLPTGSVSSTEFFEDRFVLRNAVGQREVLFGDIESVETHGDVALLRMADGGTLLVARALVPDEALEHLAR